MSESLVELKIEKLETAFLKQEDIEQEKELLLKIVDVWNYYNSLPIQHPNEKNEFATGIHILQHIAGMRILRKEHPEIFPIKN